MPRTLVLLAAIIVLPPSDTPAAPPQADHALRLNTRLRVADERDGGKVLVKHKPVTWDARKTAVVVCDMWNEHWCKGATRRVGEMAPRMNEVIKAARKKGALIIHCPSSTMDFYKDTPMRKRAQQAPKIETKIPLQRWCSLDKAREGGLPIDDSDGPSSRGLRKVSPTRSGSWSKPTPVRKDSTRVRTILAMK